MRENFGSHLQNGDAYYHASSSVSFTFPSQNVCTQQHTADSFTETLPYVSTGFQWIVATVSPHTHKTEQPHTTQYLHTKPMFTDVWLLFPFNKTEWNFYSTFSNSKTKLPHVFVHNSCILCNFYTKCCVVHFPG